MATFGNTTAETGTTLLGVSDEKYVGRFTLAESALVSKLTARVSNTGAGNLLCHVKGVIYRPLSAGYGETTDPLLGTSAEVEIAAAQAAGWVDFTFASAVSLSAGDYWLGLHIDTTGTGFCWYLLSTGGTRKANADTYSDGPTATFGTNEYSGAWKFAIYATYTVPGFVGLTVTRLLQG